MSVGVRCFAVWLVVQASVAFAQPSLSDRAWTTPSAGSFAPALSQPLTNDCNDHDASIHPGATEIFGNRIDDNCNGVADEAPDGTPSPDTSDADGDGVSVAAGDCNDTDASIHPGATEIVGNRVDDNCNGLADEDAQGNPPSGDSGDEDDDGYTLLPWSSAPPPLLANDCNDHDASIHPGATEIFGNRIDDNCNGVADEAPDGTPSPDTSDADGDGASIAAGDCNDTDASIHPGATEIVGNRVDDNCNGLADEDAQGNPPSGDTGDEDGDGYTLRPDLIFRSAFDPAG